MLWRGKRKKRRGRHGRRPAAILPTGCEVESRLDLASPDRAASPGTVVS
jgi:hypothetical protein